MASERLFRGEGVHADFRAWLGDRKREGCTILVTGDVPDDVSARASRFLFGRGERRYRVLAITDRTSESADARLPGEASVDDPETWVVDQHHGRRSIPTAATGVSADLESRREGDVSQLRDEIGAAISNYEEQSGGLAHAELRVGVDSLSPFVADDLSATRRALRTLGATVRGVDGMAHYHLRTSDDADVVDTLSPLFDVRIELRKRPGFRPEQRWHALELGETTAWVEL